MDSLIRKYRSHLSVSGKAVIAFSVWNCIKYFVLLLTGREQLPYSELSNDANTRVIFIFIVLFAALLCLIIISFSLFIGISAVKEAKGKKVGMAYLVFTAVLIALSLLSDIQILFSLSLKELENSFTLILVDLSSVFAMWQLIHSSVKLRKLGGAAV